MKLPLVSGAEAVKAFRKMGYEFDRRHGSHIILRRDSPPYRRFSIPDHKELAKGTLRALIRESGLTVEEFRKLLQLSLLLRTREPSPGACTASNAAVSDPPYTTFAGFTNFPISAASIVTTSPGCKAASSVTMIPVPVRITAGAGTGLLRSRYSANSSNLRRS